MKHAHRITILFAGGGTGGHLYPAIAMAEAIQKIETVHIAFVGTKHKIEARVVPQKGFEFHTIWISGFQRKLTLGNLLFPLKVVVSLLQSFFLILKLKPKVVVGTGGYVCGPILFAASLLGVPTVVHESNSFPGATTKMLARIVSKIFISFDVTRTWLPKNADIELVGNPTREELSAVKRKDGLKYYQLDPKKKTLLVFGGSLGAASLNNAMKKHIPEFYKNNIQLIWQTGERAGELLFNVQENEMVKVRRFIDKMEYAYAAADVVLCRSGATTLAELTRLGKPAILVPYPYAAAHHQELNAQMMVDAGAALMVHDKELESELWNAIQTLLSDDAIRKNMSLNSLHIGKPNAGKEIAEKIVAMCA